MKKVYLTKSRNFLLYLPHLSVMLKLYTNDTKRDFRVLSNQMAAWIFSFTNNIYRPYNKFTGEQQIRRTIFRIRLMKRVKIGNKGGNAIFLLKKFYSFARFSSDNIFSYKHIIYLIQLFISTDVAVYARKGVHIFCVTILTLPRNLNFKMKCD